MSSARRTPTVDPVGKPALAALPLELRRHIEEELERCRRMLAYLRER